MKKLIWISFAILLVIGGLVVYQYYYWPFWKAPPSPFIIDETVQPTPVSPETAEKYPNLPQTVPPSPQEVIKPNPEFSDYLEKTR